MYWRESIYRGASGLGKEVVGTRCYNVNSMEYHYR